MKSGMPFAGQVAVILLSFSVAGCSPFAKRSEIVLTEPQVRLNATSLSEATSAFGDLLLAYPSRRPYSYAVPPVIEVGPILNYSGESGLPEDFATVLTTILGEIGEAVAPKAPRTLRERETDQFGHDLRTGPPADLIIRGSITEAEKVLTRELSVQMDLLFEKSDGDKGPGRNSVDTGIEKGKEQEVWILTLDLHLEDRSGLIVEAVSQSVEVVRRGSSSSYGVFWRGSGIGTKTRSTVAQGKSHALRLAAQQSIIMLLGRHFRVPYWRVIPSGEPDKKLLETYRSVLASGDAVDDFRLLLFAHGVELSESLGFTEAEKRRVSALKEELGLPAKTSDVDLAMNLWLTVPYQGGKVPIKVLRSLLRQDRRSAIDALARQISPLTQGQALVVRVFFDFDSAELTKKAKEQIEQFSEAMRVSGRYEGKDWWIELIGHSDARGERARNQTLSENRAVQARVYLEHRLAPPSQRVVSRGRGSDEPFVKHPKSEQDQAKNRQVEILLIVGDRPGHSQGKAGAVKNAVPKPKSSPRLPAKQ
jgi:outer membrane protein OmpA-like peptidoglycan-associated protein